MERVTVLKSRATRRPLPSVLDGLIISRAVEGGGLARRRSQGGLSAEVTAGALGHWVWVPGAAFMRRATAEADCAPDCFGCSTCHVHSSCELTATTAAESECRAKISTDQTCALMPVRAKLS